MKLFKKDGAWITWEVHKVNEVCVLKDGVVASKI